MNKKDFQFHAQIQPDKITVLKGAGEDGDDLVRIEGWASTKGIDRDSEIVEPDAILGGISNFLKNPVLLFSHDPSRPIGKVTDISVKPEEGFWIEAVLSAAGDVKDIVTKIKEGVLRAFSIGFRALDGKLAGDVWHITELELWEVSIVSIPANADALFSMAKGLKYGSDLYVPMPKIEEMIEEKVKSLTQKAAEPVNPQPGKGNPEEAAAPQYANLVKLLDEQRGEKIAKAHAKLDNALAK